MAITTKASGSWAELTATAAVTIPGAPAAGDRMFLYATWKDFSVTASVTGWTAIGAEFTDGAVATGNGTGSMKVQAWYKDWKTGDTNPTLTFSAGVLAAAVIIILAKDATETWNEPGTVTAAWPVTATTQTISASSTIYVSNSAMVYAFIGIRDDSATFTRPTTAIDVASGITWNGNHATTPGTNFSTTTGNDMAASGGLRGVTTAGVTATLRVTATISAVETGAIKWIVQALGGQGFAQAQASIKAFDVEGVGQAQAKLNAFNVVGVGQTQAKIATTRNFGQTQADIKQTYNAFAESQANIKQTYSTFAQAQAQIVSFKSSFAQSQARIGPTTYERILRGISGLQSFWTLGEASGSTSISDYVGAITGTVNGTPTFSQASPNPLQLEPGIKFDAVTKYLTFGDNYDFISGASFTFLAWVKHTGAWIPGEQIINKEDTSTTGNHLTSANSTTFNFRMDIQNRNLAGLTGDTWQLLVGTYNGSTNRMFAYIDNINDNSTGGTGTAAVADTTSPLTIAKLAYQAGGQLSGTVASPAIFNSFISFDDVQALYTIANSGAIARPAQAQAFILKAKGLAQAAALINGTYFAPFLDTFTRSVTDGLGVSDNGDTWLYGSGFPQANYDVDGSKATIITSPTFANIAKLNQTLINTDQGLEISGQLSIDKIPAASISINIGIANNANASFSLAFGAGITLSGSNLILGNSTINSYTPNDLYNFKLHGYKSSNGLSFTRTKFWKDGNPEPGWASPTSQELINYVGYPKVSMLSSTDANAPFTFTLDNLQILQAARTESGQAQALIIRTSQAFSQAQAKITTTRVFGQANALIILSQSTHPIADETNTGWVGVSI